MDKQTGVKKTIKHICAGLLAHVDAGKTTLSEGILYTGGSLRKMGRVDNQDAFLDTYALERARGITIFAKQAVFTYEDAYITLLDTPGHVDFSAEMERTLQVLDYAILVISGADGVQGHTKTLWKLLARNHVPVFLFVNKMDQPGTDAQELLAELKRSLDSGCVDFTHQTTQEFYENAAVADEAVLEHYMEQGAVSVQEIGRLIRERKLFPCFFGSALKLKGVQELLDAVVKYAAADTDFAEKAFGGRVFKIARDEQGNRLTYLKVTSGGLRVKDELNGEKINQIRIYSGSRYEAVQEVEQGVICAVTGPLATFPGQGLGREQECWTPMLEPVLTYRIELPPECQAAQLLPKLKQLEEEEPELHIIWNEALQEIHVQIMGEVQLEILKSLIAERFGIEVTFGTGSIVYHETIANTVEGVGHFEPLRHYAEVHLLLEPGERGSGLVFAADCSEDVLDKNWQRLILTHLAEKEHIGVLTGSAITDMKITLVAGCAHAKHTEGGDFRQATYRAVRQGLMQAESVLLEPVFDFVLEIPEQNVGRAMTDMERLHGTFQLEQSEAGMQRLTGTAPVASMRGYSKEVLAYTKGMGRLFCTLKGYEPCHNTEEVLAQLGYEPEHDLENQAGSVFCAHGAGFPVAWNEVPDYMHLPAVLAADREEMDDRQFTRQNRRHSVMDEWIGVEEVDAILRQTYGANQRDSEAPRRSNWGRYKETSHPPVTRTYHYVEPKEKYLLVDGYNIIHAWKELWDLAEVNMDGARGRLLDILCNYQGVHGCNLIVVFDAYRIKGHDTETLDYHNIHVVYTKEAETADQYIERFAHDNGRKYDVMVATSDGLEQIIIRGQGCRLISAREFEEEVKATEELIRAQLEEHNRR